MSTNLKGGLAVVIVNYGTSELVLEALPALLDETSTFDHAPILIVDNASPGDDASRLAAGLEAAGAPERVRLIRSPVNGGFAAGNNAAFHEIRAMDHRPEAILLLNPDAAVCPGAIAELLRVLRTTPAAGFVGPRLENPDGSSWVAAFNFPSMAGEVFSALGINFFARHFRSTIPDSTVDVQADWVTGTAVMIRAEAFEVLGDMDDGYFLYYEEVDYMLQGARMGWQCWHAPNALVRHVAGAATGVVSAKVAQGRMPAYWFQSWARYFVKNHGAAYARVTAALRLAALALGRLQRRIRGHDVSLPERYFRDFAAATLFARLSPPPASTRAAPSLAPQSGSAHVSGL